MGQVVVSDSDVPLMTTMTTGGGGEGEGEGAMAMMKKDPLSVSKFQQQLSGEWNQRVLRRDKYNPDLSTNSVSDDDDDDLSFNSDDDDSQWSLFAPTSSMISPSTMPPRPIVESIPAEISAFDEGTSHSSSSSSSSFPQHNNTLQSTPTSTLFSSLVTAAAAANGGEGQSTIAGDGLLLQGLLQELDADYLALRMKLVRYMEATSQQPQSMEAIPSSTSTTTTVTTQQHIPTQNAVIDQTNSNSSSSSSVRGEALGRGSPKKTYWPAKSYAGR